MGEVAFEATNKTLLQVLSQAVVGSDYESVTFEIGKDGLSVAGTNKAANTWFVLRYPREEAPEGRVGGKGRITVLAEPLEKFLSAASGAHVEEKATLRISIANKVLRADFDVEGVLRRHKTVREFPYSRTSTEPALDPSDWPYAHIADPIGLKMASTSFEKSQESEKVGVQVVADRLTLHRSDDDVLELHAVTKGNSSTVVFHRIFQKLSVLCQLSDVRPLRVSVKKEGAVCFQLHFAGSGTLTYFVLPVVEEY